MHWTQAAGVSGTTHYSDDGQWSIHSIGVRRHQLFHGEEPVEEFTSLGKAQKAAATARRSPSSS